VDVSWLEGVQSGGFGGLGTAFLVQAAVGLSRVPTGFYGEAVRLIAEGRLWGPALEMAGLLFFAWVGLFLAWRALLRFHRAPASRMAGRPSAADRFLARAPGVEGLLIRRELLDLYRNPRARLLAFVPLILAVAMRLLSLRPLLVHWRGASTDAWIVAGLTVYGVVVFALTFAQNLFGYDGESLGALLAAPLDPRRVLRAKLRALMIAAALVAGVQSTLFALYLAHARLVPWLLGLASAAVLVPVLLIAGAFVSIRFATRYHANLERRDRQPRVAIVTGMIAAGLGAAPLVLLLRARGQAAPRLEDAAVLVALALLAALLFRALRPLAERTFARSREEVLQALRRE
jgi:ABC-2 type transport system permease protein